MKLRIALITTLFIYSTPSFAIFCPSNFNQINIGDTIAIVEKQCGKAASQKSTVSEANQPQEWTYYITITTPYTAAVPANQGTIKATFAFVNNKVVNMTVNGVTLNASSICNGKNIQPGSTLQDVEGACGTPALVTKSNLPGAANVPPPTKIDTWTYSGPQTPTPTTLIFENGVLKERKTD